MLEIGLPKGPRLKLMKYFERERNSSPPPCSSCVALQAHIRRINAELVRYKLENEAMTRLIEDLQQTNARGALQPGWVMTEEEADDNADAKKLTLAKLEAEKAAERAEAKKLALATLLMVLSLIPTFCLLGQSLATKSIDGQTMKGKYTSFRQLFFNC